MYIHHVNKFLTLQKLLMCLLLVLARLEKNNEIIKQFGLAVNQLSRPMIYQKFSRNTTRVVPKPVLILPWRSCNAIYRNSDETRVFRSLLSFKQAPVDICTSNISRISTGFVKTVAHTPLENERCKKRTKRKWEEHSTFGSLKSVRGKVSAVAGEHVEITRVSRRSVTK